jgi:hypothetical protein
MTAFKLFTGERITVGFVLFRISSDKKEGRGKASYKCGSITMRVKNQRRLLFQSLGR